MRTALLVADTYLVLGSLHILLSSSFASEASGTVEELKRIGEWNRRFFEIGGRELLENAQEIELCSAIEAALALARQHHRARHARLDATLPAEAPYVGIESIIQRAVLDVALNAAEAAGPRPRSTSRSPPVGGALDPHGRGQRPGNPAGAPQPDP